MPLTPLPVSCAAVALLASACGGGNLYSTSKTPSQPPSATAPSTTAAAFNDGGTVDATHLTKVDVTARNFVFSPSTIIARPGQVLTLVVHNASTTPHNFTQATSSINSDLDPSGTVTVHLTVPASGVLSFHCEYHANRGMAGTIGPAGAQAPTQPAASSSGSSAPYGYGG